MTSGINHITVSCRDPYQLALFWQQVTGYQEDPDGANEPGEDEAYLEPPGGGTALLFVQVPEEKTIRNRVHLDLMPIDLTRNEEVDRLLAIGATLVDDRRTPNGRGWAVLADPEGNEFCVEGSAAERAAPS
jgi:catechol 2,3-dioxygenase-like lactoylglutathione lyase family enzyme